MKSKFPGNALGMTLSACLVLFSLYMLDWGPWSFIGLFVALYTFFISIEIMIDNKLNP